MSAPVTVIGPNPGPQTDFLSCRATICIFGGAAGSSKTYGLLLEGARILSLRGGSGVIFRRKSVELTGPGSIWEDSQGLYSIMGCRSREARVLEWRNSETGSLLEFRHLQHEKDVHGQQGKQPILYGLDEGTHFTAYQFWYLISRLRSSKEAGFDPYMRVTCNPDPDSFIRDLIDWWIDDDGYPIPERSGALRWFVRVKDSLQWFGSQQEAYDAFPEHWGVLKGGKLHRFETKEEAHEAFPDDEVSQIVWPMSLTFIPGKLSDNPQLVQNDPSYLGKLLSLDKVQRERLLYGNWNIRYEKGNVFRPREWCDFLDHIPEEVVAEARGWDLAGTKPTKKNKDPDWTRAVKWSRGVSGKFYITPGPGCQEDPGAVRRLVRKTSIDDGMQIHQAFWQDPAQGGKYQAHDFKNMLVHCPHSFRVENEKKHVYAGPWAAQMEQGNIAIIRNEYTDSFCAELAQFPDGEHDDWVDAASRGYLQIAVPDVSDADFDVPAGVGWGSSW